VQAAVGGALATETVAVWVVTELVAGQHVTVV
jgi:hypothetical protein